MKIHRFTYSFLAIFTAFCVLTMSVRFSVDIHFCQESIESVAFSQTDFSENKCSENGCASNEIFGQNMECCATTTITNSTNISSFFENQTSIQVQKSVVTPVVQTIFSSISTGKIITSKEVSRLNYSSVLLVKDIFILTEQLLC